MVCLINVRANKRPDKQPATESERARHQEGDRQRKKGKARESDTDSCSDRRKIKDNDSH